MSGKWFLLMVRARGMLFVVFFAILLCALNPCYVLYRASLRPDNPPETFRLEDLIGVWKADYRRYEWRRCGGVYEVEVKEKEQAASLIEWLFLREDKTFDQVLVDRRGRIPEQRAQGIWWVERFPDKVTRLHLEGGRFFAGDVCYYFPELSQSGGGYYSADQTGHELIFKRGKAVLIVGWDRFTKELYLEYPFVGGDPDAPMVVEFARVKEEEFPIGSSKP